MYTHPLGSKYILLQHYSKKIISAVASCYQKAWWLIMKLLYQKLDLKAFFFLKKWVLLVGISFFKKGTMSKAMVF